MPLHLDGSCKLKIDFIKIIGFLFLFLRKKISLKLNNKIVEKNHVNMIETIV